MQLRAEGVVAMNLNQFEYLLAIYQQGSITKAAQMLFVSAPAVSNAVKSLEDELGYPILVRLQNGVSFTPEGEEAIHILQELQAGIVRLKQIGHSDKTIAGEFILGGTSHFNSAVLLPLILQMHARYPELKLHLRGGDSDTTISAVGQDTVHIGLVLICELDAAVMFREISRNQLEFYQLFLDEMRFVVRKQHPLLQKAHLTMHDVFQYPYICYVETVHKYVPDFFLSLISRMSGEKETYYQEKADNKLLNMVRINDRESLYEMLLHTNGVTLMPFSIQDYLQEKQPGLQFLELSDPRLRCQVGLIHKKRPASRAEIVLWEEMCRLLQK